MKFTGQFTVTVDGRFTLTCADRTEARQWAWFYANMGLTSVTKGV